MCGCDHQSVGMTRRDWLALLVLPGARYAVSSALAETAFSPVAALKSRVKVPAEGDRRGYRAEASVRLLGLTVFSRAGVGSGFAAAHDGSEGSLLRFGAGSFPERARGLNRLGYIEEWSGGGAGAYFGFMTSSPEESVAQARRALEGPGDPVHQFAVAEGWVGPRTAAGAVARCALPAHVSWKDAPRLLPELRERFRREAGAAREVESGSAAHTLLHLLRDAFRSRAPRLEAGYIYNAIRYRLRLEQELDPAMGRRLAARRLCADPARLVRADGEIRRGGASGVTRFSFWAEPERSLLPVRIELQARSYLKLAFEHDPSLPPAELEQI